MRNDQIVNKMIGIIKKLQGYVVDRMSQLVPVPK